MGEKLDEEMLDVTVCDVTLDGFGTFTMLSWKADGHHNITFAKQVHGEVHVTAPFPPELKSEEDKEEAARKLAGLGYSLIELSEHTRPPS